MSSFIKSRWTNASQNYVQVSCVSKMLALIYTARENSIDLFMATERMMLAKCFVLITSAIELLSMSIFWKTVLGLHKWRAFS